MIFLLALLPATALTVAGYLVLYLSNRSEGSLRTFGKYLGFWAFTLAGLVILGALFAAAHGGPRWRMHEIRDGVHCPWPGVPPFPPRVEERRLLPLPPPAPPGAPPTAAPGTAQPESPATVPVH